VAKKEDEEMTNRGGEDETEATGAEAAVAGEGGGAAPRAARFGEGREGAGARRERGVAGPRQGFFGRAGQFLHDVRVELRRVTWPRAVEVRNTTIITIVAVVFFAVYLWLVDHAFTRLVGLLQALVAKVF
jgi:preprotein translocase subunit SecE